MAHRPRTAARLLVTLLAAATTLVAGHDAGTAYAAADPAHSRAAADVAPVSAVADLAQGRAATASSAQAGRPAAAGNDGDTATRWCAATGTTGQWWQVDLGAHADLTGTEVTWEFARDYRYRIETSPDGVSWRLAADRTAGADAVQVRTDSFTHRARFVRVTVTGLPARTWASFLEFKVFGTLVETPAPGPEPDPRLREQCTGTAPIRCHYDLAPGHYDVTVILGDAASAGVTSVQAEARRVMLAATSTAAGERRRYTLTVNVRQPEGQPTGQGGTGTAGLDLIFGGTAPRLAGIGIAAARPRVLYLAGDSTVCDQPEAPYGGWGQQLPQYFGPGLSVANYADSGESSGSFLRLTSLFRTMGPLIEPGDVTLIQFGHNDKKATDADFTANLIGLIAGVEAEGGSPVLITPPVRRGFQAGRLTATALHVNEVGTDLPAVMRRVAADRGVPLVDLTASSRALVESMGESASQQLFLTQADDGVRDNTHFSSYGADRMARLVIDGLRQAGVSALVPYLRQR